MSLVLLNDYKEVLQIQGADEDEFVGILSQEIEQFIKTYLNHPIEATTYKELYCGSGNNILLLNHSPIISVSKIEIYKGLDNSNQEMWVELAQGTDYDRMIVRDDFIFLDYYDFIRGDYNYRVTYVAGYYDCPEDIQLACKKLVKLAYDELKKSNSIGRASNSQSSGYTANVTWDKNEVNNILRTISYHRVMNV